MTMNPCLLQLVAELASGRSPRRRPHADSVTRFPADRAAAGDGPGLAVSYRRSVPLRRARARAGIGTTSPAASIPARISMRRSTGFRAGICRTTAPIQFRRRVSSRLPACSIARAKRRSMPTFCLTVDFLRNWERRHGRIPAGSWILMRTDWSKRLDPVAYQNFDETGQHTPGPDADAVKFLVDERQVLGFGSEAIGTDAGQAFHLKPPYPCHYYMHGSGRFGLQCLTNLDLLPPTGAIIIAAPLKIKEGSGSPLRVARAGANAGERPQRAVRTRASGRKDVLGRSADECRRYSCCISAPTSGPFPSCCNGRRAGMASIDCSPRAT